jgi:hypothetical protein
MPVVTPAGAAAAPDTPIAAAATTLATITVNRRKITITLPFLSGQ